MNAVLYRRSLFRGVCRRHDGKKWVALIKTNCRQRYLGSFVDEEMAARTYDAVAVKLHGAAARLNFPQPNEGK